MHRDSTLLPLCLRLWHFGPLPPFPTPYHWPLFRLCTLAPPPLCPPLQHSALFYGHCKTHLQRLQKYLENFATNEFIFVVLWNVREHDNKMHILFINISLGNHKQETTKPFSIGSQNEDHQTFNFKEWFLKTKIIELKHYLQAWRINGGIFSCVGCDVWQTKKIRRGRKRKTTITKLAFVFNYLFYFYSMKMLQKLNNPNQLFHNWMEFDCFWNKWNTQEEGWIVC